MSNYGYPFHSPAQKLKIDSMTHWINNHWIPRRPEHQWTMLSVSQICMDVSVLDKFTDEQIIDGDYLYVESHPIESDYPVVYNYYHEGHLSSRIGSFVYTFHHRASGATREVLMVAAYFNDMKQVTSLACVPDDFIESWASFVRICQQLSRPEARVTVIGGNQQAYEPRVDWDDIVLPDDLKQELHNDIASFFARGVSVYRDLKLNPFRKLLLAGVPGTGKTMLCNALAKWALEQSYQAIYVSGADAQGAHFFKIQQALSVAASGDRPALILLEEIDAFLQPSQKALILNVLDGVESFENEQGTLLVATTNYPESIDERVLKRPGRLDRIYIIPVVKGRAVAEQMLRNYLGDMWHDDHAQLAGKLVNYPGAFIREVAVYALTRIIQEEEQELSLALLNDSFERLRAQIDARDEFITQRMTEKRETGFVRNLPNGSGD
jgi:AAA+ superfamily predicted ATPase